MSKITSLRKWFEAAAEVAGEVPEMYTLGQVDRWDSEQLPVQVYEWPPPNEVLDREFDPGYGGEEAQPIYAWSENWIWFLGCYDGSEWLQILPRHPTASCVPRHVGG
jgi:hypothetical protein